MVIEVVAWRMKTQLLLMPTLELKRMINSNWKPKSYRVFRENLAFNAAAHSERDIIKE